MSSLKSGDLIGKKVLDNDAQIIGKIIEIEFDRKTWTISDINMEVDKDNIEEMGFQKPRLIGSVRCNIPVTEINAVSDVVSLKKSATELKGIAKRV